MVRQVQMGMHLWLHGCVEARIGLCPVSAPSPWSKHQGYWDLHPHAPEPIIPLQAPLFGEEEPRDAAPL